jgi:hypothetical protein
MTRWLIVAGLVVLNGILGAGVYERLSERKADAQVGVGPRPDFVVVTGVNNGQTVVYTMDALMGRMVANRIDGVSGQFMPPVVRDVTADFKRIP